MCCSRGASSTPACLLAPDPMLVIKSSGILSQLYANANLGRRAEQEQGVWRRPAAAVPRPSYDFSFFLMNSYEQFQVLDLAGTLEMVLG